MQVAGDHVLILVEEAARAGFAGTSDLQDQLRARRARGSSRPTRAPRPSARRARQAPRRGVPADRRERLTPPARLPVLLLAVVTAALFAGFLVWSNTHHVACEDSGGGTVRGMILLARWGGLGAGIVALAAAWVASARASGQRPSVVFRAVCIGAAAIGLAACVAPHSPIAGPLYVVLVPATLAVVFWLLPALVILVLMLIAVRFFPADQRALRAVQLRSRCGSRSWPCPIRRRRADLAVPALPGLSELGLDDAVADRVDRGLDAVLHLELSRMLAIVVAGSARADDEPRRRSRSSPCPPRGGGALRARAG